jgi:hypothetical protein
VAGRPGMCSKRMARARDRAPQLTITVISTTRSLGRDATIRVILGGRSEARYVASRPSWVRALSVVMGMSCLLGREPASVSTITRANCAGHAAVIPAAPGEPPGDEAFRGAVSRCAVSRGAGARTLAAFRDGRDRPPLVAARVGWHAASWGSQS